MIDTKVARRDVLKAVTALPLFGLPSLAAAAGEQSLTAGLTREHVYAHRFANWLRPNEWERIRSVGAAAFFESQLSQKDQLIETVSASLYPNYTLGIPETLTTINASLSGAMHGELRKVTLFRNLHSKAQLAEVMLEFWQDHFTTRHFDRYGNQFTVYKEKELRPLVFGKFRDILLTVMRSPSMLVFLNNDQNTKNRGNENLARELMELHTLGQGRGYTEQDVKEVARCLTGWTRGSGLLNQGRFQFNANIHDDGEKTVLGHLIPAGGGESDGVKVIDILAQHPNTALFIAERLAKHFVSDAPSPDFVRSLAQVFTSTGGDTAAMLRYIVRSDEFLNSAGQKLSRPRRFTISVLRAFDVHIDELLPTTVEGALWKLGHIPYGWETPDGYPAANDTWLSGMGLATRLNYAMHEASQQPIVATLRLFKQAGSRACRMFPINGFPTTARSITRLMADKLLHRTLPPEIENSLASYIVPGNPDGKMSLSAAQARADEVAGLMLSSPLFMKV